MSAMSGSAIRGSDAACSQITLDNPVITVIVTASLIINNIIVVVIINCEKHNLIESIVTISTTTATNV